MAIRVQDTSPAVLAMSAEWPLLEALMGGTAAMRAAGEKLLPKWPNEDRESYASRLATATLFQAFRRTVGVMAGKPFSKALTYAEDVPEQIKALCDNVDLQGRNLHTFAAELMLMALSMGIAGVLVDHPPTGGAVRTLADQKRIGARPYFIAIKHCDVLGWQEETVDGAVRLTQLRIAETAEVKDGHYGTKCIKRIRVYEPGRWELHEEIEGKPGEYALIDEGTTTLQAMPYVPFYGERTGFMTGKCPLIDLAYQNVKHWQSQSDQDTILHVARVPILAAIGVDDPTWKLTVGASAAVKLPLGADLKFVEHSGAAIAAGAASLLALEEQMIQSGAELLVKKPGQRSATESASDAEANKCDLQRIVEQFEDALDQCLQFMADWLGLPEGGHVSLFKDFGASSLTDASAQLILAMQQGGLITKQTAIREQQRRGMLAADIDPEIELALVDGEGPALGTIG